MVEDSFGSRRRRDRSSIIARILEVARGGALKTHVMYKASLNFAQLNDYLFFLLDLNLLEVAGNPKKAIYKTTDKGLRYLQSYKEIGKLLKKGKETT